MKGSCDIGYDVTTISYSDRIPDGEWHDTCVFIGIRSTMSVNCFIINNMYNACYLDIKEDTSLVKIATITKKKTSANADNVPVSAHKPRAGRGLLVWGH